MRAVPLHRILALAGISLLAANLSAQETYCWDEDGKRVCSDRVPPESARFDREVVNDQGITVRIEQGEITPEEQREMDERAALEEERNRIEQERMQYDRMLLDTYLTVQAIEDLRDRRLEILEGQSRVIEHYLRSHHKELEDLQEDTERFAPQSDREDAPALPVNLIRNIERARSQIQIREQQLEQNRKNQQIIREDFDNDINRFRELKNLGA